MSNNEFAPETAPGAISLISGDVSSDPLPPDPETEGPPLVEKPAPRSSRSGQGGRGKKMDRKAGAEENGKTAKAENRNRETSPEHETTPRDKNTNKDRKSAGAGLSPARSTSPRGSRRAASGKREEPAAKTEGKTATGKSSAKRIRKAGLPAGVSNVDDKILDVSAASDALPEVATALPLEAVTENFPPASIEPVLTAEVKKDAPPIPAAPVMSGPGAAETSQASAASSSPSDTAGTTDIPDVAGVAGAPEARDTADKEGPFTFPDPDILDADFSIPHADESPEASPPARRRKPRRGGRGRKRAQGESRDSAEAPHLPPEQDLEESPETMMGETGNPEIEASDPPAPPEAGHERLDTPTAEALEAETVEAEALVTDAETAEELSAEDPETVSPDEATAEEDAVVARKKGRVREKAETESKTRLPARGLMKMLISVLPGEEVEVVLTEDNRVCEYYVEMMHHAKIRGNIYKGVISNIDTSLQAAFVNYGAARNGFLQIDEVHPDYYLQPHETGRGHRYPPIQKVLKTGQEVLVQVVKEPNGSKGAFLTTWISLAGRFLVLTPGQEEIGISRKVEDTDERNRLRELIRGLNPGQGLGAIVRTVSAGTSKTTLQKDLGYLKRLWKDIRKRGATEKAPALIHREPGLASRALRDYLADDITEIWVDDAETAESIRETANLLFPRKTDLVHLYESEKESLWERFGIQKQLEQVHAREVHMPSGGRLVFDQTEALMAIDINSGRISGKNNFEAMAFRTNMEAATTIAEQLRLRDIGGQIVIDFIEMRDADHCREVEKTLRNAMRWDRARHDIGKMSSFGLLQIVRQRTGSSAISITLEPCPCCGGTGLRRNLEWQAIQTLRELQRAMRHARGEGLPCCVHCVEPDLAFYLLNHKRERLTWLEQHFGLPLEVRIRGFVDTDPVSPSARNCQPPQNAQTNGSRSAQRPGSTKNARREKKQEKGKRSDKEDTEIKEEGREEVTEEVGEETMEAREPIPLC